MQIELPYGRTTLPIDLGAGRAVSVYRARPARSLPDPASACAEAIENPIGTPPLRSIARGRSDAAVVISDITRPVPNRLILPQIIEAIRRGGIPDERITILIATGTHRPNTRQEVEEMVGTGILDRHPYRNHDAGDGSHAPLGEVASGVPLAVDAGYLSAGLKVITGLIQPHLLAGYSGGRKLVVPGLTDLPSLRGLHGYDVVASEKTAYGVLDGNPFHELALAGARKAGVDFSLNVTLDPDGHPNGFFAGDLDEAHRSGCDFVASQVSVPAAPGAAAGIASGGGDPMDLTLYQSIKGIVALKPFVREGGRMLLVARCEEGAGPSDFLGLLSEAKDPGAFLERMARPDFFRKDQWMVQELCDIGRRWRITCLSSGLSESEMPPWIDLRTDPAEAVATVTEASGPVVVIPDGPRDAPIPATA